MALMSVTEWETPLRLNRCDSSWWRYQCNTIITDDTEGGSAKECSFAFLKRWIPPFLVISGIVEFSNVLQKKVSGLVAVTVGADDDAKEADVWPAVLIYITNTEDGSQTVRARYTNKRWGESWEFLLGMEEFLWYMIFLFYWYFLPWYTAYLRE